MKKANTDKILIFVLFLFVFLIVQFHSVEASNTYYHCDYINGAGACVPDTFGSYPNDSTCGGSVQTPASLNGCPPSPTGYECVPVPGTSNQTCKAVTNSNPTFKQLSACNTNCNPTATFYGCNFTTGLCSASTAGSYGDQEKCQANCSKTNAYYDCVGGVCVPDSNPTGGEIIFTNDSSCGGNSLDPASANGCPRASTYYHCDYINGAGACVQDAYGSYSENTCGGSTQFPSSKNGCVAGPTGYECVPNPTGPITRSCRSVNTPGPTYTQLSNCNSECNPSVTFYGCDYANGTCDAIHAGSYSSQASCQLNCSKTKKYYKCVSGACIQDSNPTSGEKIFLDSSCGGGCPPPPIYYHCDYTIPTNPKCVLTTNGSPYPYDDTCGGNYCNGSSTCVGGAGGVADCDAFTGIECNACCEVNQQCTYTWPGTWPTGTQDTGGKCIGSAKLAIDGVGAGPGFCCDVDLNNHKIAGENLAFGYQACCDSSTEPYTHVRSKDKKTIGDCCPLTTPAFLSHPYIKLAFAANPSNLCPKDSKGNQACCPAAQGKCAIGAKGDSICLKAGACVRDSDCGTDTSFCMNNNTQIQSIYYYCNLGQSDDGGNSGTCETIIKDKTCGSDWVGSTYCRPHYTCRDNSTPVMCKGKMICGSCLNANSYKDNPKNNPVLAFFSNALKDLKSLLTPRIFTAQIVGPGRPCACENGSQGKYNQTATACICQGNSCMLNEKACFIDANLNCTACPGDKCTCKNGSKGKIQDDGTCGDCAVPDPAVPIWDHTSDVMANRADTVCVENNNQASCQPKKSCSLSGASCQKDADCPAGQTCKASLTAVNLDNCKGTLGYFCSTSRQDVETRAMGCDAGDSPDKTVNKEYLKNNTFCYYKNSVVKSCGCTPNAPGCGVDPATGYGTITESSTCTSCVGSTSLPTPTNKSTASAAVCGNPQLKTMPGISCGPFQDVKMCPGGLEVKFGSPCVLILPGSGITVPSGSGTGMPSCYYQTSPITCGNSCLPGQSTGNGCICNQDGQTQTCSGSCSPSGATSQCAKGQQQCSSGKWTQCSDSKCLSPYSNPHTVCNSDGTTSLQEGCDANAPMGSCCQSGQTNPYYTCNACTPKWKCTDWSACQDPSAFSGEVGSCQQSRTCTDSNGCGTKTGAPATTQSCSCTSTPVNWWPFNESAADVSGGIVPDLASGWNGTAQKGITLKPNLTNASGKLIISQPITFTNASDSYISLPASAAPITPPPSSTQASVSFGAWVNIPKEAVGHKNAILSVDSGYKQYGIITGADGKLGCRVGDGNAIVYSANSVAGGSLCAYCVYDSTKQTLSIYINGLLDTSVGVPNDIVYSNNNNAFIGSDGTPADNLQGTLYDLKIFNQALIQGQFQEICHPTCVSNWDCSNWSQCADGKESRVCGDSNKCSVPTNPPPVTQSCKGAYNEINSCGTSESTCACNTGDKKSCPCGGSVTCNPATGTFPACAGSHLECKQDSNGTGNACECVTNTAGGDNSNKCQAQGAVCGCCSGSAKCTCGTGTKTCNADGTWDYSKCSGAADSQEGICTCDSHVSPGADTCQLGQPSACLPKGAIQSCPNGGHQTCTEVNNSGLAELAWAPACPPPNNCNGSTPTACVSGVCVGLSAGSQGDGSGCVVGNNSACQQTMCNSAGKCVVVPKGQGDNSGCSVSANNGVTGINPKCTHCNYATDICETGTFNDEACNSSTCPGSYCDSTGVCHQADANHHSDFYGCTNIGHQDSVCTKCVKDSYYDNTGVCAYGLPDGTGCKVGTDKANCPVTPTTYCGSDGTCNYADSDNSADKSYCTNVGEQDSKCTQCVLDYNNYYTGKCIYGTYTGNSCNVGTDTANCPTGIAPTYCGSDGKCNYADQNHFPDGSDCTNIGEKDSKCVKCAYSQIKCGSYCCNSWEVCDTNSATCVPKCTSSQVGCGSNCCNRGKTCNINSGTCEEIPPPCTSSQVGCGSNCCDQGQTCNINSGTCEGLAGLSGFAVIHEPYCTGIPETGLATFTWKSSVAQTGLEFDISTAYDANDDTVFVGNEVYSVVLGTGVNTATVYVKRALINPTSACAPQCDHINYGQSYYWRVGKSGQWAYYSDSKGSPTTYVFHFVHPAPEPIYSVQPVGPQQPANFTDASICFSEDEMYSCSDTSTCYNPDGSMYACKKATGSPAYAWSFGDGPSAKSNATGSVSYTYSVPRTYSTSLKVCDEINCCTAVASAVVQTTKAGTIPLWQEVSPFQQKK